MPTEPSSGRRTRTSITWFKARQPTISRSPNICSRLAFAGHCRTSNASILAQRKERESNPQGLRSSGFGPDAIAHWLALPTTPGLEDSPWGLNFQARSRVFEPAGLAQVSEAGFEPAISCSRSRRVDQATLLEDFTISVPEAGLEPAISCSQSRRVSQSTLLGDGTRGT